MIKSCQNCWSTLLRRTLGKEQRFKLTKLVTLIYEPLRRRTATNLRFM